jgi:hypothetical protein
MNFDVLFVRRLQFQHRSAMIRYESSKPTMRIFNLNLSIRMLQQFNDNEEFQLEIQDIAKDLLSYSL